MFFSHNWFCKGAKWQEKKPIVLKYSGCFAAYFGSGPVYIKVVGPQVGEVTRSGLPHLTRKHDHIKMRDYMGRRVTSPTWGPPPPCKQAFRHVFILFVLFRLIFISFSNTTLLNKSYTCTVNIHKRQSATKRKLQLEADKKETWHNKNINGN